MWRLEVALDRSSSGTSVGAWTDCEWVDMAGLVAFDLDGVVREDEEPSGRFSPKIHCFTCSSICSASFGRLQTNLAKSMTTARGSRQSRIG